MLDTKSFGIRISALRKDKELTQAEMADALRISYQAVSSWERGETMPDITKLPEIAQLLNVSIDELFSSAAEPVTGEKIMRLEPDAGITALSPSSPSPQAAPPAPAAIGFSVKQAMEMLPFVDREAAGEIVRKILQNTVEQGADLSVLKDALPFINRSAADEIARLMIESGYIGDPDEFFPFISRDLAGELVLRKLDGGAAPNTLLDSMPFIRKDAADKIVLRMIEEKHDFDLEDIMPFVSRQTADAAVRYRLDAGEMVKPDDVLPFLSRQMAGELALKWLDISTDKT